MASARSGLVTSPFPITGIFLFSSLFDLLHEILQFLPLGRVHHGRHLPGELLQRFLRESAIPFSLLHRGKQLFHQLIFAFSFILRDLIPQGIGRVPLLGGLFSGE